MSSLTSSSWSATAPTPSCVAGTLLPSLLRRLSQPGHHVVTYFTATRPTSASSTVSPPADGGREARDTVGNAAAAASASPATVCFGVFEDREVNRRWVVELQPLGDDSIPAWRLRRSDAAELGVTDEARAGDETSADVSADVALRGGRYVMLPDSWREEELAAGEARTAAAAPPPNSTTQGDSIATGDAKAETAVDPASVGAKEVPTPSPLPEQRQAAVTPTATAARAPVASSSPTPPVSSTPTLRDASMDELKQHHSVLLRRLVQALAPQRMSVPQLVRSLCVQAPNSAEMICELHDGDNSSGSSNTSLSEKTATQRYTAADVAAAAELLTSAHPRQPQLRELSSEAYLFMNIDGFADGELRRKAVNRAYPALANHWPASARLLDAMERYADREVVMATRKRHPELSGDTQSHKRRKRQRSNSSSASRSSGSESDDDEGEERDKGRQTTSTSATATASTAAAVVSSPTAPTQRRFQSLHEYPKSLESGNLHAWYGGADGAKVREALQSATLILTQQQPDRAALTSPPIANAEDVQVRRTQYDALAAAEDAVVRRLRDYRDTVQELKAWYTADRCAPQFNAELEAWVSTQEETRTQLMALHEKLHTARYTLQRDLTDYLHLHALRVL